MVAAPTMAAATDQAQIGGPGSAKNMATVKTAPKTSPTAPTSRRPRTSASWPPTMMPRAPGVLVPSGEQA